MFKAKTEEDLKQLESLEVAVVTQAISAYREVVLSPEFYELERLRADARHNEASALLNAERKAKKTERERWQSIVAGKNAALSDKDAALADKDMALADKDAEIADKDAEIEKLRAMLNNK